MRRRRSIAMLLDNPKCLMRKGERYAPSKVVAASVGAGSLNVETMLRELGSIVSQAIPLMALYIFFASGLVLFEYQPWHLSV